jgi:hypothetical protein
LLHLLLLLLLPLLLQVQAATGRQHQRHLLWLQPASTNKHAKGSTVRATKLAEATEHKGQMC